MKKLLTLNSLALLLLFAAGCTEKDGIDDDTSFLGTASATNPGKLFEISNDNTGIVNITPTGQGASSFTVGFGHGTGSGASATVSPGGYATHAYPEGTYTVTIITKDIAGNATTATYPLTVTYRAPENIQITTTVEAHLLKVKATALYAASYLVYFGDVANETATAMASGAEISHTYAAGGNYTVKVVALSGGVAKSEATQPVVITDPLGLPLSFEDPNVNYFFGTFGGGQQFAKVANPNPSGGNTSATVGKFTRGFESWSGTYTPLNTAVDFAVGKKITVWAYNPDPALIGKMLNLELEASPQISNGVAVKKVAFTTSGAWEPLLFDYSGIAGIPAGATFSQVVLRFNDAFEGDGVGGTGSVVYVDNFTLSN